MTEYKQIIASCDNRNGSLTPDGFVDYVSNIAKTKGAKDVRKILE